MKKINILLIIPTIFLFSCKTTEPTTSVLKVQPGTPESALLQTESEEQNKTDEAAEVVENIPEWCKLMPKSDFAIYACGIGNSSNLNMSNSRALLDGKVKIASRIDNQVSSRMSNFLEDIGSSNNEEMKQASEIVVKSVSRETQVAGYKELKSDFQSIGNKYQTYVLLEYPIGKANRILYNKIKEDSTLSNQEAADEALAELEAEIDKKISND